jgi:hypothetical protein
MPPGIIKVVFFRCQSWVCHALDKAIGAPPSLDRVKTRLANVLAVFRAEQSTGGSVRIP